MTLVRAAASAGGQAPAGGRARHTLRLCGAAPVPQLDPAAAWGAPARQILRLVTRQLLTYEARRDLRDWQAVAPVPDLAEAVPSTYNAGLGASQRGYVLHLRTDVRWDTTPPRPVTAEDAVRGLKRLANPLATSPAFTWFASAVRGIAEYREAFVRAVPPSRATATALAEWQEEHEIAGVFALDASSLVIELVRPAPDFPDLLALPAATPAPIEYGAFLPGSEELARHLHSCGPYLVAAVGAAGLRLEPNPVWLQASDPVRRRLLGAIELRATSPPADVASQVAAGLADLPWACALPAGPAGRAESAGAGAGAETDGLPWTLDACLVPNVAGGHAALRDPVVRRALALAIDRTDLCAAASVHGGPVGGEVRPATGIVPPGNEGHTDAPAPAAGPGGRSDPKTARALLRTAGCAAGLALAAVHAPGDAAAREILGRCAGHLERVGIRLRIGELAPEAVGAPVWDLFLRSWSADFHHRNGRVFLQSLLQSGAVANVGGYCDPEVDALVARALEAAVEPAPKAAAAWQAVERRALEQAAVIPLLFRRPLAVRLRGRRVRDGWAVPALGYAEDLGGVWIDEEA